MADPLTPPAQPAPKRPATGILADPLLRALAIFVAGMALLLAIDLATEPVGATGQDRAIEGALATANEALGEVAEPAAFEEEGQDADRAERARSAAFFLEQATLAWRRGDATAPEQAAAELGSAAVLALLGKLWLLGWLLLPLGALAARLACPRREGRAPHWAEIFAAASLGGSGGLIALALAVHALGAPASFVLGPLVAALVVLNAWLLRRHARLDRSATLLRLAPLLVILAALLVLARDVLLHLAILP